MCLGDKQLRKSREILRRIQSFPFFYILDWVFLIKGLVHPYA